MTWLRAKTKKKKEVLSCCDSCLYLAITIVAVCQPWRLLTPHVRLDIKVARLQQGFKSEVISLVEVYSPHFNVREMRASKEFTESNL